MRLRLGSGMWGLLGLTLTMCQIRYHSHCGIIVALDSSEP